MRYYAMKKTLWRATLLTALLANGLLACAKTPASLGKERAALEAAIHHWTAAVNAQDVATLNKTMTEDVELLDDTSTVTGREATIAALREVVAHGQLGAVSREITIAGDVAWHVVGLARTRQDGDVQGVGLALEIWKRVNGEWKLHRRMTTGNGTPDVSVTRPSTKEPVLDQPRN